MADKSNSHKAQLHNWYISEHDFGGKMRKIAHGIVTGHKKLEDSISIHFIMCPKILKVENL